MIVDQATERESDRKAQHMRMRSGFGVGLTSRRTHDDENLDIAYEEEKVAYNQYRDVFNQPESHRSSDLHQQINKI